MSFEKDIELAKAQTEALKASAIVNKSLVRVGLAAGKDLMCYSLNERYNFVNSISISKY